MYMNLLGKPTDADLDKFPHGLLTGPHEWDPSVLDYTQCATTGDPSWTPDPSQHAVHGPRIDEFGHFQGRVHHTLTAIKSQPIDFDKSRPFLAGSTNIPLRNPSTKILNGLLPPLGIL